MIHFEGLSAVSGFRYAAISFDGTAKLNLGLLFSDMKETKGSAVYTKSDIKAAPVLLSKKMDALGSRKRAILINSGVANAFTGKDGMDTSLACVNAMSDSLNIHPSECYIGSTGVIGKKLNSSIIHGIEDLANKLSPDHSIDFIKASMTTDTKVKQANVRFIINGKTINIAACAKGSGMIMPDMATMLACVISDVSIEHNILDIALRQVMDDTFNCITIDGDTSTNDSVFMLTNGVADNDTINSVDSPEYDIFKNNLFKLLEHMAKEIVNDGEGITKFLTIEVGGSPDRDIAKAIAMSIANSPLVKTSIFGEDLNWGRILMAIGKAGTGLNFDQIDLAINNHCIVKAGESLADEPAYTDAKASLKNRDVLINIDVHQGDSGIRVWTCDFSYDYVTINAKYTT